MFFMNILNCFSFSFLVFAVCVVVLFMTKLLLQKPYTNPVYSFKELLLVGYNPKTNWFFAAQQYFCPTVTVHLGKIIALVYCHFFGFTVA